MTMFEGEGSTESTAPIESSAPESAPEQTSAPEASAPAQVSDPQADRVLTQKTEPESIRAKMEKKMASAKARDEARGIKAKVDVMAKIPTEKPAEAPKPSENPPEELPLVAAEKPGLKYKFTDSSQQQQEKDFPEWAKSAAKDPETEKEIRSVLEKAGGLDFVLPRYKQTREELGEVKPRLQNYEHNVSEMKEMYAQGNMAGIFEKLGIAEEKVLQYAVERAKFYQLPPEQQSIIQAQQNAERNAQLAEQNAMSTQERYEEQARQIKQLQLSTVLQRSDVSQAEKAFDERVGKKGAFFEQVKLLGETTWYRTGGKVDLTPEQAITQVMEMYGLSGAQAPAMSQQAQAAPPAAAAAMAAPAQAQPPAQQVKVIPNVGSRASSPASGRPKPRSIEDLQKLRKEMLG